MARVSPKQINFSAGEFGPVAKARTDIDRYSAGADLIENMLPWTQGAAQRRSGTKYVSNAKSATNNTALRRFKYSTVQSYVLEFGEQYARFFSNRGVVESSPGVPYEITTPYAHTDVRTLRISQSLDVMYLTHKSYAMRKLIRYGATNFSLVSVDLKDGPYLNDNYSPDVSLTAGMVLTYSTTGHVKIITNTLSTISGAANNGAGLIRITTSAAANWQTGDRVYIVNVSGTTEANGTWVVTRIDSTHFDLQASAFVNAYTSGGSMYAAPFRSTDVGRLVRLRFGTSWCWFNITAYNDPRDVTVEVKGGSPTPGTDASAFRLGAYSATTGYPVCSIFHQGRLYIGGGGIFPQNFYGSNVGDYENFATTDLSGTVGNSAGLALSLDTNDVESIMWMTSDEQGMPIGTSSGPHILRASVLNEAITPTNAVAKKIEGFGAANFPACQLGKASIFISSDLRRINELTWFYELSGFKAVDLTEIADHIGYEGFVSEIDAQKSPLPLIWVARSDGQLCAAVYKRELDGLKIGWARQILGGFSDAAGNPPLVKSVCMCPSPDNTVDDIWLVVKRYVNGSVVQNIEYMSALFRAFDDQQDAFFVDAGATYDSPLDIVSISSADPANVEVTAHGLSTGNKVLIRGVYGIYDNATDKNSQINGKKFTITVVDPDNFTLDGFDSTDYTAYVSGGAVRKCVTTVSGLTWLESQTVKILGDGAILKDATVTGGSVTLSSASGTVQVGLGYSSKLRQLHLDAGSQDGTALGKTQKISQVAFLVDRTASFKVGTSFEDLRMVDVKFRSVDDPLGQAPPLFSGITEQQFIEDPYGNGEDSNRICIEQSAPVPMTILGIFPQIETQDFQS